MSDWTSTHGKKKAEACAKMVLGGGSVSVSRCVGGKGEVCPERGMGRWCGGLEGRIGKIGFVFF